MEKYRLAAGEARKSATTAREKEHLGDKKSDKTSVLSKNLQEEKNEKIFMRGDGVHSFGRVMFLFLGV